MKEKWKAIDGYEGLYEVSNTGKVRSFKKSRKGHILVPAATRGYDSVGLCSGDGSKTTVLVHRLVATAFVPNPNGYKEVNHKDENKKNNNADNLEWCTRAYNMSFKTARVRQGVSCGKPVEQMTIDGIAVALYSSAEMAGKILGIDASSIHKCCKNKRDHAAGYKWRYSNTSFFKVQ